MNGPTVGGVFISYSSHDRAIVSAAAGLLRAGGATVFQDVVDIEFGTRWKEALFNALAECERVMVFWSAAAAKSEWVEREWRCALLARKRIVPMLLDDTPLPPPLGEFHGVPDMVDMLRAAVRIGPANDRATSVAVANEPTARRDRAQGLLVAAVGSLATLVVAMGAWMVLHPGLPQADPSRGGPDDGPASAIGEWLDHPWIVLAALGLLLVVATALYGRARRKRAKPGQGPAAAGPQAPSQADFAALGRQFTAALFDAPLDHRGD